jgi:hypothetical protein
VGGGHETGELFVRDLYELEPIAGTVERAHDAVDSIAGKSEQAINAPFAEAIEQVI